MDWRGFGIVHRSRTLFCRAVPNPSLTIRNFCIAVPHAGSVQRCGDNYLATLRAVAVAPELDPAHPGLTTTASGVWTVESESEAAVFFDVLGLFMVLALLLTYAALSLCAHRVSCIVPRAGKGQSRTKPSPRVWGNKWFREIAN